MTPGDWDRLTRLVVIAGRSWRSHRLWPDLRQEGLVVAWQNRDLSDAFIITKARSRMIDVARRELGRNDGRPRRHELLVIDAAPDTFVAACVDPVDPVLEWDLSGRKRVIAEQLIDGATKQEIAAEIGVSPSRVSQLLAVWRTRLAATAQFTPGKAD